MKSLFPTYCRGLGYLVLALALLFPLVIYYLGELTDNNLLLIKASIKLILIFGAVLMLFAKRKNEQVMADYRARSLVYGVFLTTLFLFTDMFMHILSQDLSYSDGSSFLIFLILSNACFEYFTFSKK